MIMKRSLLIGAALLVAAVGMAQQLKPMHKSMATQLPQMNKQCQLAESLSAVKKGPRKSFSTGLYYINPAGAYYGGWDQIGGSGFYNSTLIVPPFMVIPFENNSTVDGVWTVNGEEHPDNVDGNFYNSYAYRGFGYSLYLPPSLEANDVYTFGEKNYLKLNNKISSSWQDGFIRTDSITSMYKTDPRAAIEYEGSYYGPYQSWGILKTDNLFGSGTWKSSNDEEYTSVGAIQVFPKPMSPLFITEVDVEALTFTEPIPEGKQLVAYITGVKESAYSDGTPYTAADMDNVLATLYCNSTDTLDFYSTSTRNSKTIYTGTLRYTAPGEEDEVGNIIPQNIVIDQAYAIVFMGFEQEGIDCGFYGMEVVDEDQDYKESATLLLTQDGETLQQLGYRGFIDLAVSIYGMFDRAVCEPQPNYYNFENPDLNYNVVRVPAEGSSDEYGFGNMTEGATASPLVVNDETADGYPGVPVLTNVYWFDEVNDLLNYDVIDLPDWIETYNVDPSYYDNGGLNIVFFKAQPLPEGVTGRSAVVRVVGQEVMMDGEKKYSAISGPIVILQGDAVYDSKVSDAVRNETFTGTAYNLAGQKVDAAYKGIFVQDGKKFIRR